MGEYKRAYTKCEKLSFDKVKFRNLIKDLGMTQRDFMAKIGMSDGAISGFVKAEGIPLYVAQAIQLKYGIEPEQYAYEPPKYEPEKHNDEQMDIHTVQHAVAYTIVNDKRVAETIRYNVKVALDEFIAKPANQAILKQIVADAFRGL